ncbi:MAG: hypothetical protein WCY78_07075 [Sphaerochaetaceae bacterium]
MLKRGAIAILAIISVKSVFLNTDFMFYPELPTPYVLYNSAILKGRSPFSS